MSTPTPDARGLRVALVASRFNDFIVASLVQGARAAWERHGGAAADLTLLNVPGAFELPLASKALAASGDYAAVVALGCVIRGDTPHFDFVAREAAAGLMRAGLEGRQWPISGHGIGKNRRMTSIASRVVSYS